MAQQTEIEGRVTDVQTGESLPGVNVLVKGTAIGTASDVDGTYRLAVPSRRDTLVFSFVGFKTRTVPIRGRTEINIALRPITVAGEEVTVVAYGEQSTETLTNSVTSVSNEQLAKVPTANVGNALYGQSPGLQIIQRSGEPGRDDPEIFLRGVSSLSTGRSHPIFVIDGVKVRDARSISQLDPDNIANISILKDASATAVYGVEGANGAVVVTTKRGRQGPARISIRTSAGLQVPTHMQEYIGSHRYAQLYNEAQLNDGANPSQVRFSPEAIEAFRTGSDPLIYPDMNWIDYLTKPAALQSRTNVNISGGTENVQYFVSGSHLKQDGFFRVFDSDYDFNPTFDRYNLRTNLDMDVTPSTHIALTASGRIGSKVRVHVFGNDQFLWRKIYRAAPFAGAGLVDGKLVTSGGRYIPGPKLDVFRQYYGNGYVRQIRNILNLNLAARQQLDMITEGLQLQVKGAYNVGFTQNKHLNASTAVYQPHYRTDVDAEAAGDSTVVFQKIDTDSKLNYSDFYWRDRDWYVEARLQYNRDFGPHSLKGLMMYNQRKNYYPPDPEGIPRGLVSTVGRINYNYDRRYLLEVSTGYNGSENFAKGRRFGLFPAVSGGWILTNEPYMPELPFLNFLKLRASWGLVGNDSGIGRFLYLADQYNTDRPRTRGYNFGIDVPQDFPGASEGRIGNPGVTWETSEKQNYGLNMRLFDNKLDLSLDYFYEYRDQILTTLNTVPAYVAANLPAANIGEVENRGYEAQLKWQQQFGDFFYSIGGNLSFARNKIVYMDEVSRNELYLRRTGHPVGQEFGHVYDGFFTEEDLEPDSGVPEHPYNPKPGDLKFKDLNGDGAVNSDDQRPVGYPEYPEYTFGANLSLRYKHFDLSMVWAGATNTSRELGFEPYRTPFGPKGQWSMMKWQADSRWTPENAGTASYPRLSHQARARRNNMDADFWMVDASYVRLKNAEIGYRLGPKILESVGLRNMRIYLNGYNLLTFSGMMDQYSIDPEQTAFPAGEYPLMRVFNLGVNVDF